MEFSIVQQISNKDISASYCPNEIGKRASEPSWCTLNENLKNLILPQIPLISGTIEEAYFLKIEKLTNMKEVISKSSWGGIFLVLQLFRNYCAFLRQTQLVPLWINVPKHDPNVKKYFWSLPAALWVLEGQLLPQNALFGTFHDFLNYPKLSLDVT